MHAPPNDKATFRGRSLFPPVVGILVLGVVGTWSCTSSRGSPSNSKVVRVSDGDTVTIAGDGRRLKVRLFGVDCPERAMPFGDAATRFTRQAVFGRRVTIVRRGKRRDRHGRIVAEVRWIVDGRERSLGPQLIEAGLAWWYRRYAPKDAQLARLESAARKARRGLWSQPSPRPPWRWRRDRRARYKRSGDQPRKARLHQPRKARLRCNVSSKVCHRRRCRHYRCRRCTATFDSEAAAQRAGFHLHRRSR